MNHDYSNWRKASASTNQGGSCVEVAYRSGCFGVRDSKQHGHGPVLQFGAVAWQSFTTGIRNGGFSLR